MELAMELSQIATLRRVLEIFCARHELEFAERSLGEFRAAVGAETHITYLGRRGILPIVALLFAVTASSGGLYPAFAISRADPAPVLHTNRGSAETASSGLLRSLLVVVPFAVILSTLAIVMTPPRGVPSRLTRWKSSPFTPLMP